MNGILLDPVTLDVSFSGGKFALGNTDEQNIALNLLCQPGDAHDYPYLGVGILDSINDDDNGGKLLSRIRVSLTKDNAKVKSAKIVNGQFQIDGSY